MDMKASNASAHGSAAVLSQLGTVLAELPGLISDRVQLISLEVQRCAQALESIVVLLVAGAICVCTAWFALWVGIALLLTELHLGWPWAVAAVLLLNAVAAALALLRVRRLLPLLAMPATVRCMTLNERPNDPPSETSAAPSPEDVSNTR